jgi:hypothetical protein
MHKAETKTSYSGSFYPFTEARSSLRVMFQHDIVVYRIYTELPNIYLDGKSLEFL